MKTKRWLSLLTAMAMLLGLVAVSTSAEETTDPVPDLTLAGVMSQETLEKNGHVRLTENFADNLYQAEYENVDGTRTVYFFSTPVKYVTDEGEVAYIDTSLKSTGLFDRIKGYAYKTDGNAVDVYFPSQSDGNVLLEWEDISITQQICEADETSITGNVAAARSVQYAANNSANAPTYSYQPTVTGYSGTVQFANLAAVEDVAIQFSGEDVTALSAMGDIIGIRSGNKTVASVYGGELVDANGVFVQCAEVTAASQNGVHTVTFSFDSTAIPANVAYPLTFTYYTSADQSAWETTSATESASARSATTATNTSCAIQDTMVNEATPNTNDSNATALVLQGGTGRACRIYTKFNLSSLSNIRYDRILSARYSILQYYNYDYTQGEHFDVEMHQVSGSYNTSTVTWNNKPAHYEQRLAGDSIIPKEEEVNGVTTVTPLAHYHFMLTSLVQGWLQGLPNNGIVLLMRDEGVATSDGRRFPSSTFTNSIGPTFTVTYTTDTTSSDNIGIEDDEYYYIKCKGSVTENSTSTDPLYLTAPTPNATDPRTYARIQPFTGGATQKWKVVPTGDGYYYLRPASNSNFYLYVMGGEFYELHAKSLPENSDYNPYRKWKFVRNWDGSYHILSLYGSGELGVSVSSTIANHIPFHGEPEVTMDHLDDWTLEKVNKGAANAYCFDKNAEGYKPNEDGSGWLDTYTFAMEHKYLSKEGLPFVSLTPYQRTLDAMRYDDAILLNSSAYNAIATMDDVDLWLFSGHGGTSTMLFGTIPTTSNPEDAASRLVVSSAQVSGNYAALQDTYVKNNLKSLMFAFFNSCHTGRSTDSFSNGEIYDMVGYTYFLGGHTVVGHVNMTSTNTDLWEQFFFQKCYQGLTVCEAMEAADNLLMNYLYSADLYASLFNRNILGDTAVALNPQPSQTEVTQ